jgi:predicted PurR-regulated permease PerM
VAGAFLAIPVMAMLLALLEIYGKRYELIDEVSQVIDREESTEMSKAPHHKEAE